MIPDPIHAFAAQRRLTLRDAVQTFLQVVVLRNLRHKEARLIGGTALVLGHGNPRFSEDIDLTQVTDPLALRASLEASSGELERWLSAKASLRAPKPGHSTWVLRVRPAPQMQARLHVDSQIFSAHTDCPIVVDFPGFNPTVVAGVEVAEIMANKLIALAMRAYLGGRDLFDLWFHWLRGQGSRANTAHILTLLDMKLAERGLTKGLWLQRLRPRLASPDLKRARREWQRYLPRDFTRPDVAQAIVRQVQELPAMVESQA